MKGILSKIGIKKKSKKDLSSKDKLEKVKSDKKGEGFYRLITKEIDTEKSLKEGVLNKYHFIVEKKSTKKSIKKAIELFFKVKVIKINLMNYKAYRKSLNPKAKRKKSYKKAVITLAKGDSLKD